MSLLAKLKAAEKQKPLQADKPDGKTIALAGNPNVGKSTVFNALTGLNQHTGNWPGKTVTNARGKYIHNDQTYVLVDLPGTYSLLAHSVEEEVARDFICFENMDAVIVVCDATCLERNLNLVLQTKELTDKVIVCVNMMDEAKKKKIHLDLPALSRLLGCPVCGCAARSGKGLKELMDCTEAVCANMNRTADVVLTYPQPIEDAVKRLEPYLAVHVKDVRMRRWVSLRLLDEDASLNASIEKYAGNDIHSDAALLSTLREARENIEKSGIPLDKISNCIVSTIVAQADAISRQCVRFDNVHYNSRDRKLDKILTSKYSGFPIMLLLFALVFYLTISGANVPSKLLSSGFFWLEERLTDFFVLLHAPPWVQGLFIQGMYRTLTWVVSVMLPPMAIFFPLFTLLEDFGYLPRVAFNLDKYFKKCSACGKQALTMCMGFGCNAAGVVGCRIIDSPRERLIAIITNNFVPCNGRFPTLIAIITMFFGISAAAPAQNIVSALLLTGVIVLGVCMTLLLSKLLSKTLLKGVPSSFTLELPPYRRPQLGKVIVRSILDRTLFVLGRAVLVAAPAGLIIWGLANIHIHDISLLAHCTGFLDPFARLLGLDGVILMAFILGFPANEIVIPIVIMSYMATGSISELASLTQLKELLVSNGWTALTAVCTMLFSLMHFPCSTTCLTIKKETQSLKWTALSIAIPTVTGMLGCFLVANIARLLALA